MKSYFAVIILICSMLVLPLPASAQETSGGFTEGSILVGYDNRACSGALAGSIRYNSGTSCTEYCDGTSWTCPSSVGCVGPGGCSTPGDVCADGTIFTGWHPDDNAPLYTTRCDSGRTYSGGCSGSRVTKAWNNGNGGGYIQTSTTSISDGSGNTNTLQSGGAKEDSDSSTGGIQPHQAAQYCADLNIHGHTDWYLPAAGELYLMRIYRSAIGDFANNSYWSSTEADGSDIAYQAEFETSKGAELDENDKSDSFNLRCMRK